MPSSRGPPGTRTGEATCLSLSLCLSVQQLREEFEKTGCVLVTPPRKEVKDPSRAKLLTSVEISAIDQFISRTHDANGAVTTAAIIQHLQDTHDLVVSRRVIAYCLQHYLGYGYKLRKGKKVTRDPNRIDKIRQYLLDFSAGIR